MSQKSLVRGVKGTGFKASFFKIAIVGADGRKWTKEQEEKVRSMIQGLLVDWKARRDMRLFQDGTDIGEIVVVSGHCPVGEERWYCVDCSTKELPDKGWLGSWDENIHHQSSHKRVIKVYDEGGVDTEVEIACAKLGIKTELYLAESGRWIDIWHDEKGTRLSKKKLGFRSRNIQIAEACSILYDLEPKGKCRHCGGSGTKVISKEPLDLSRLVRKIKEKHYLVKCYYCEGDGSSSGGTHALREARKRGKEVHKVIIS